VATLPPVAPGDEELGALEHVDLDAGGALRCPGLRQHERDELLFHPGTPGESMRAAAARDKWPFG